MKAEIYDLDKQIAKNDLEINQVEITSQASKTEAEKAREKME